MIVRFGPWNKEKVASLNIIISFIWLLGITILFPFFQNSNLVEIFNASPQLYVGCFFTPRFNYPDLKLEIIKIIFLSSQAVFFNYLVIAALARFSIPYFKTNLCCSRFNVSNFIVALSS